MKKENIIKLIIVCISLCTLVYVASTKLYDKGYNDASDDATDFFISILDSQIKSDSTVTKLKVISKLDTVNYTLSKKSIWEYKHNK